MTDPITSPDPITELRKLLDRLPLETFGDVYYPKHRSFVKVAYGDDARKAHKTDLLGAFDGLIEVLATSAGRETAPPKVLELELDPPLFVDGVKAFNVSELLSFVLNAIRLRGLAVVAERPPSEPRYPIPLNAQQLEAVKNWAADDRLWTTQETVEINLRIFARVILAGQSSASAPAGEKK